MENKNSALEGMTTSFREGWYGVELAEVLSKPRQMKRVTLGGATYVIFRGESGRLYCLADKCCHKGASIAAAGSGGKVEGDCVRCPYHGLLFDGSGACVEVPSLQKDKRISPALKQDHFPVIETAGLIWLKPTSEIEGGERFSQIDQLTGDYHAISGNLSFSVPESLVSFEMLNQSKLDLSPLQRYLKLLGAQEPECQTRFIAPAAIEITFNFGKNKVIIRLANTPETPTRTKTYYLAARNFATGPLQKALADGVFHSFIKSLVSKLEEKLRKVHVGQSQYRLEPQCKEQEAFLNHLREAATIEWKEDYLSF